MPKVSIVIPVYNVEKYLENCVNSFINQTLKDIEIILVDDGSIDGCPQICDRYAEIDPRVRVIHKQNAGVSAARNDGMGIATGEYIIFCDSDDWIENEGLEILYYRAIGVGADIVIGDVFQAYGNEKKLAIFYGDEFTTDNHEFISKLICADIFRNYCPNPPKSGPAFGYGGPWNKLVRRSLLQENAIAFDVRLKGIFDDILYTAYILSVAEVVSYVSKPVYDYRITAVSLTHSFNPNVLKINEAIFCSWQDFFSKQRDADKYQIPYFACVIRRLEESLKLYFLNTENSKPKNILKKELKATAKSEPYKTALKNVEVNKLSKKQKLLTVLGKMGLIKFAFLIHY